MKKILALAAVAALTAGVSAYAANPFSDVSTDDWAYQAVSDLSDQGVVEGYPDGTFKGERNMTRYELAQIIARLMAKEDQLNAEQQATLDKLAGEYADELANLGVRVSNLEKKVGNLSWSGDARMRFQQKSNAKGVTKKTGEYNGRMRINVKGDVNESTYVKGRMVTNMYFKDPKANDGETYMDQLYVHHQFGDKVGVELGRFYMAMGNNDEIYGDSFDGAKATYTDGAFNAEVGYGRLQAAQRDENENLVKGTEDTFYAKAGFNEAKYGLTANYLKASQALGGTYQGKADDGIQMWGIDANAMVTNDVKVYGSYFQETKQKGDPTYWYAGVQYGQSNRKQPGSFNLGVQYNDVETGSVLGPTGLWNSNVYCVADYKKDDVTFWSVLGDVVLQKNVILHGEYSFDVNGDKNDYKDAYSFSLNYKF